MKEDFKNGLTPYEISLKYGLEMADVYKELGMIERTIPSDDVFSDKLF